MSKKQTAERDPDPVLDNRGSILLLKPHAKPAKAAGFEPEFHAPVDTCPKCGTVYFEPQACDWCRVKTRPAI